jgi:DNA-binding LacI/PurR family transcriptional regulator
MSRAPTIVDVARAAGVSKATVSRVLRGESKVSPESKKSVGRAVKELGYRPNLVARSLKERVSSVVGMVAGDLRNPYFVDILHGVYAAADAVGHRVIVASGHDALGGEETAVETIMEFRVAGLILASPSMSMATVSRLADGVPVAIEGRSDAPSKFDVVTSDDVLGGHLVIDHLVALGHSRILILTDDSPSAIDRRKGFEAAVATSGIKGSVMRGTTLATAEGGYLAMRRILKGRRLPTAVAAGNDVIACGVMSAIEEAGLSVPGDISVTGFDDIELANMRQFNLTTVRQDRTAIGRNCFEVVYNRSQNPKQVKPRRLIFSPGLVVRESTGPAPTP